MSTSDCLLVRKTDARTVPSPPAPFRMLSRACFPGGSVNIYVRMCESFHLVCQLGSSWMSRTTLPTGLHRTLHSRWWDGVGTQVFRQVSFQVAFDGQILPLSICHLHIRSPSAGIFAPECLFFCCCCFCRAAQLVHFMAERKKLDAAGF